MDGAVTSTEGGRERDYSETPSIGERRRHTCRACRAVRHGRPRERGRQGRHRLRRHQSFRNTNVKRASPGRRLPGSGWSSYQMNLMQPPGTSVCHKGAGGALTNGAVQGDGWCAPRPRTSVTTAATACRSRAATPVTVAGQTYATRTIVSTGP